MGRPLAESRAALERGIPRPRNTKDRPVGGLHVPADRGRSRCLATAILPDNPPSRQVENRGFRQRRSYVACALPLLRRAFQPEGEVVPASQLAAASTAAFPPPRRSTSQPSLPLTLPRMQAGRPRRRGLSSPFLPAEGGSPYRLPREASERLALA